MGQTRSNICNLKSSRIMWHNWMGPNSTTELMFGGIKSRQTYSYMYNGNIEVGRILHKTALIYGALCNVL